MMMVRVVVTMTVIITMPMVFVVYAAYFVSHQ